MATQRNTELTVVAVAELGEHELRDVLDKEARRLLNVSGEEFVRRWKAGHYRDDSDPHVTQVAMLLPDAW